MQRPIGSFYLLLGTWLAVAGCESATSAAPAADFDVAQDVAAGDDADTGGSTADTQTSDNAGTGSDSSAETPVCRAVLSGAVEAVLECTPGADNFVALNYYAPDNQLTLSVALPGAPGNNGLQLSVALTEDGPPKEGLTFAPGGAMDAMTIQQYQDGEVVRQWGATYKLDGVPDQGTYAGTVKAYKLVGEVEGFATNEAEGSLTATLPVLPGYEPGAEVKLDLQFRLRK